MRENESASNNILYVIVFLLQKSGADFLLKLEVK